MTQLKRVVILNILSLGWNCFYEENYSFTADIKKGVYLLVLSRTSINISGQILPENTLIIFDDSHRISYCANDNFLVCDWIMFETQGDTEFIETAEIVFNEPIMNIDHVFISNLIQNLTIEFYSFCSKRMKMIDFMLKTILMKVAENRFNREVSQSTEPYYSMLMELREKIYRNPQMKWNVDSLAAEVNMSRSYFQHIYREIFGVSCITDVISGKIEKAKEILSETGCTVSQVAAMCGYDNEEHFMRQFKKIVGVTPSAYRRRINAAPKNI